MKSLIVVILICISTVLVGQEVDCKKFKDGKFKIVDADRGDSIIERYGSRQIEYGDASKLKLEFKVKWLDDCSYTLELKRVIENPNEIPLPDNMILTIEIVKTSENSFTMVSSSNLYEMVMETEVFKIE